jgi:hypothetical protein
MGSTLWQRWKNLRSLHYPTYSLNTPDAMQLSGDRLLQWPARRICMSSDESNSCNEENNKTISHAHRSQEVQQVPRGLSDQAVGDLSWPGLSANAARGAAESIRQAVLVFQIENQGSTITWAMLSR